MERVLLHWFAKAAPSEDAMVSAASWHALMRRPVQRILRLQDAAVADVLLQNDWIRDWQQSTTALSFLAFQEALTRFATCVTSSDNAELHAQLLTLLDEETRAQPESGSSTDAAAVGATAIDVQSWRALPSTSGPRTVAGAAALSAAPSAAEALLPARPTIIDIDAAWLRERLAGLLRVTTFSGPTTRWDAGAQQCAPVGGSGLAALGFRQVLHEAHAAKVVSVRLGPAPSTGSKGARTVDEDVAPLLALQNVVPEHIWPMLPNIPAMWSHLVHGSASALSPSDAPSAIVDAPTGALTHQHQATPVAAVRAAISAAPAALECTLADARMTAACDDALAPTLSLVGRAMATVEERAHTRCRILCVGNPTPLCESLALRMAHALGARYIEPRSLLLLCAQTARAEMASHTPSGGVKLGGRFAPPPSPDLPPPSLLQSLGAHLLQFIDARCAAARASTYPSDSAAAGAQETLNTLHNDAPWLEHVPAEVASQAIAFALLDAYTSGCDVVVANYFVDDAQVVAVKSALTALGGDAAAAAGVLQAALARFMTSTASGMVGEEEEDGEGAQSSRASDAALADTASAAAAAAAAAEATRASNRVRFAEGTKAPAPDPLAAQVTPVEEKPEDLLSDAEFLLKCVRRAASSFSNELAQWASRASDQLQKNAEYRATLKASVVRLQAVAMLRSEEGLRRCLPAQVCCIREDAHLMPPVAQRLLTCCPSIVLDARYTLPADTGDVQAALQAVSEDDIRQRVRVGGAQDACTLPPLPPRRKRKPTADGTNADLSSDQGSKEDDGSAGATDDGDAEDAAIASSALDALSSPAEEKEEEEEEEEEEDGQIPSDTAPYVLPTGLLTIGVASTLPRALIASHMWSPTPHDARDDLEAATSANSRSHQACAQPSLARIAPMLLSFLSLDVSSPTLVSKAKAPCLISRVCPLSSTLATDDMFMLAVETLDLCPRLLVGARRARPLHLVPLADDEDDTLPLDARGLQPRALLAYMHKLQDHALQAMASAGTFPDASQPVRVLVGHRTSVGLAQPPQPEPEAEDERENAEDDEAQLEDATHRRLDLDAEVDELVNEEEGAGEGEGEGDDTAPPEAADATATATLPPSPLPVKVQLPDASMRWRVRHVEAVPHAKWWSHAACATSRVRVALPDDEALGLGAPTEAPTAEEGDADSFGTPDGALSEAEETLSSWWEGMAEKVSPAAQTSFETLTAPPALSKPLFSSFMVFCPVSLHEDGVWVYGEAAFAVEYDGHLFMCASEAYRNLFLSFPETYCALSARPSTSVRAVVLGPTSASAQGQQLAASASCVARQLCVPHVDVGALLAQLLALHESQPASFAPNSIVNALACSTLREGGEVPPHLLARLVELELMRIATSSEAWAGVDVVSSSAQTGTNRALDRVLPRIHVAAPGMAGAARDTNHAVALVAWYGRPDAEVEALAAAAAQAAAAREAEVTDALATLGAQQAKKKVPARKAQEALDAETKRLAALQSSTQQAAMKFQQLWLQAITSASPLHVSSSENEDGDGSTRVQTRDAGAAEDAAAAAGEEEEWSKVGASVYERLLSTLPPTLRVSTSKLASVLPCGTWRQVMKAFDPSARQPTLRLRSAVAAGVSASATARGVDVGMDALPRIVHALCGINLLPSVGMTRTPSRSGYNAGDAAADGEEEEEAAAVPPPRALPFLRLPAALELAQHVVRSNASDAHATLPSASNLPRGMAVALDARSLPPYPAHGILNSSSGGGGVGSGGSSSGNSALGWLLCGLPASPTLWQLLHLKGIVPHVIACPEDVLYAATSAPNGDEDEQGAAAVEAAAAEEDVDADASDGDAHAQAAMAAGNCASSVSESLQASVEDAALSAAVFVPSVPSMKALTRGVRTSTARFWAPMGVRLSGYCLPPPKDKDGSEEQRSRMTASLLHALDLCLPQLAWRGSGEGEEDAADNDDADGVAPLLLRTCAVALHTSRTLLSPALPPLTDASSAEDGEAAASSGSALPSALRATALNHGCAQLAVCSSAAALALQCDPSTFLRTAYAAMEPSLCAHQPVRKYVWVVSAPGSLLESVLRAHVRAPASRDGVAAAESAAWQHVRVLSVPQLLARTDAAAQPAGEERLARRLLDALPPGCTGVVFTNGWACERAHVAQLRAHFVQPSHFLLLDAPAPPSEADAPSEDDDEAAHAKYADAVHAAHALAERMQASAATLEAAGVQPLEYDAAADDAEGDSGEEEGEQQQQQHLRGAASGVVDHADSAQQRRRRWELARVEWLLQHACCTQSAGSYLPLQPRVLPLRTALSALHKGHAVLSRYRFQCPVSLHEWRAHDDARELVDVGLRLFRVGVRASLDAAAEAAAAAGEEEQDEDHATERALSSDADVLEAWPLDDASLTPPPVAVLMGRVCYFVSSPQRAIAFLQDARAYTAQPPAGPIAPRALIAVLQPDAKQTEATCAEAVARAQTVAAHVASEMALPLLTAQGVVARAVRDQLTSGRLHTGDAMPPTLLPACVARAVLSYKVRAAGGCVLDANLMAQPGVLPALLRCSLLPTLTIVLAPPSPAPAAPHGATADGDGTGVSTCAEQGQRADTVMMLPVSDALEPCVPLAMDEDGVAQAEEAMQSLSSAAAGAELPATAPSNGNRGSGARVDAVTSCLLARTSSILWMQLCEAPENTAAQRSASADKAAPSLAAQLQSLMQRVVQSHSALRSTLAHVHMAQPTPLSGLLLPLSSTHALPAFEVPCCAVAWSTSRRMRLLTDALAQHKHGVSWLGCVWYTARTSKMQQVLASPFRILRGCGLPKPREHVAVRLRVEALPGGVPPATHEVAHAGLCPVCATAFAESYLPRQLCSANMLPAGYPYIVLRYDDRVWRCCSEDHAATFAAAPQYHVAAMRQLATQRPLVATPAAVLLSASASSANSSPLRPQPAGSAEASTRLQKLHAAAKQNTNYGGYLEMSVLPFVSAALSAADTYIAGAKGRSGDVATISSDALRFIALHLQAHNPHAKPHVRARRRHLLQTFASGGADPWMLNGEHSSAGGVSMRDSPPRNHNVQQRP